jgi:hypothetical protein
LERWEPPRATGSEPIRRRRPMREVPSREIPEIWLMVGIRLALTIVILLTVLFDDLRDMMSYVAVVIIVALVALVIQTDREQTHTVRRQTMMDLFILLAVVPIVILNGFVAAEPGSLLPAERATLLQTSGGLLIVLAIAIWLAMTLFPEERSLVPAVLLPGLIMIVAINFVLHDYRNQTVLAMLAVSYFIGTATVALGSVVDEPVRRHVPGAFYVATLMAGLVLFDPGLGNLGDRSGLVQTFFGLFALLSLAVLFVVPNPSFDQIRLSAGRSATRERQPRSERNSDDSGRNAAERS